MTGSTATEVRTRRVFYIPGYDPIHPRRYRELYRSESAKQAQISGYENSQSSKTASGPYGWHVGAMIDGADVTADIDVLLWSDIVRDSMETPVPATYLQLLRTAWIYISTGALRRLMWMRKGPVIAALYPVGMLILQLAIAFAFGGHASDQRRIAADALCGDRGSNRRNCGGHRLVCRHFAVVSQKG